MYEECDLAHISFPKCASNDFDICEPASKVLNFLGYGFYRDNLDRGIVVGNLRNDRSDMRPDIYETFVSPAQPNEKGSCNLIVNKNSNIFRTAV